MSRGCEHKAAHVTSKTSFTYALVCQSLAGVGPRRIRTDLSLVEGSRLSRYANKFLLWPMSLAVLPGTFDKDFVHVCAELDPFPMSWGAQGNPEVGSCYHARCPHEE